MRFFAFVTLAPSVLMLACGSDPKPDPQTPDTAPVAPPATQVAPIAADQNQKPGDNPSQSQINISDEIKKACGISDTEARFAFDSANIRSSDQQILGKLATCFTTGALKGREMRLVGHADPRGDEEYNFVLGGQRADNVKGYLVTQGIADSQVATSSRGELDARGTDETSWAMDRRVDIMLGQ